VPDPHPPDQPAALDPPMLPFALVGSGLWAVAGVVLTIAGAPTMWRWTCLAGVLLGVAAVPIMVVHDRRRARSRAGAPPQAGV
jgi:hypothetical protein